MMKLEHGQLTEIAKKAECSVSFVCDVVRGRRRPSAQMAKRIATALTELGYPTFWLELSNPDDELQETVQEAMKVLVLRGEPFYPERKAQVAAG